MRHYATDVASRLIRYEGFEYFLAARDQGRGVLVLPGHAGTWELSSFYHSLARYPMGMVIRRLHNPFADAMLTRFDGSMAIAYCARTTWRDGC